MRNINDILKDLGEISQTSESDKRHFEFLMKLLPTRNYDALVRHLDKATERVIHTSDYKATLRELREHFKVKSKKNAEKRLTKLMTAINNRHRSPAAVQEELDKGGAVVINEVDQATGLTPLMVAIARKNEELIRLLLRNGATLENVVNIDRRLNDSLDTALHLAVLMKIPELVVMILTRQPDVNVQNKFGIAPLHTAAAGLNRDEYAHLLVNKGADPSISFEMRGEQITPMIMAISNNNVGLVKAIMEKGYQPTQFDLKVAKESQTKFAHNDEVYNLLKHPYREEKNRIVRASRNSMFKLHDPQLSLISSVVFMENHLMKGEVLSNLKNIYDDKSNQVMKPLLDVLMLAAEGKHAEGVNKDKKLKIIIANKNGLDGLRPSGHSMTGQAGRNSVFVGEGEDAPNVMAALLHELKHFADAQVYRNGKPYADGLESAKFPELRAELQAAVESYNALPESQKNPVDDHIYESLESIFEDYEGELQDHEFLVKVPEVIGYLGVQDGYDWLKKNVPELLNFYEECFNPACLAYLEKQNQVAEAAMQARAGNAMK